MTSRLRCRLAQNLNPTNTIECKMFYCKPEKDKKSSFIFEACSSDTDITTIEKPCHLIIDCSSSDGNHVGSIDWLFGGLEIHSNSRNIEVYAVPEGKDFGGHEYWQTYRGSKVEDAPDSASNNLKDDLGEELYHTIILPPASKPATIKSLHLKLLSLRPAKCTRAFVKKLKLKGRIPEASKSSSDAETGSSTHQVQENMLTKQKQASPRSTPSPDSTEDLSKAISGLVMMIQTIQSNMESSIQSTIGEFSKHSFNQHQNWTGKIAALEHNVSNLKDSVEGLNESVKLLSKQSEQMSADKDENEFKEFDLESMRQILKEERQLMAKELLLQNEQMLSQVLDKLKCNCRPVEISTNASEIEKNIVEELEDEPHK